VGSAVRPGAVGGTSAIAASMAVVMGPRILLVKRKIRSCNRAMPASGSSFRRRVFVVMPLEKEVPKKPDSDSAPQTDAKERVLQVDFNAVYEKALWFARGAPRVVSAEETSHQW
jgi:hypothetical protein